MKVLPTLVGQFYTDFDAAWELNLQAQRVAEGVGDVLVCDGSRVLQGMILHNRDRAGVPGMQQAPTHFPYLSLRELLLPDHEPACIALLMELVDEDYSVRRLRRLLQTPAGHDFNTTISRLLDRVEGELLPRRPSELSWDKLTGQQLMALLAIAEITRMGVPADRLRSLLACLVASMPRVVEMVILGFQVFLVTDLEGHHAVWSDGDMADDLIVGAEHSSEPAILLCMNNIVNRVFEAMGFGRSQVRRHFIHAYAETAQLRRREQKPAEENPGMDGASHG